MKKLLCVLSVFVFSACHKAPDADEPVALDGVVEETIGFNESVSLNAPEMKTTERKLIQNGSINFEVTDVSKIRHSIMALTTDVGGYIASETTHKNDDLQTHYEQVVRIPENQLDAFVSRVEALATHIDDRSFSAQDVTEEYVDLGSRLIAKKELEARFREIVKNAATVEDILKVEGQIGIVRSEIEAIQGRLKFLSNKTSYSTITLTYYQPYQVPTIVPPGIGSKFADAFFSGWDSVVQLGIGLTSIWPYLLLMSAGVWLFVRRRRKENFKLAQ